MTDSETHTARAIAWFVVFAFSLMLLATLLGATTERRKDLLFVGPAPHCIGDAVECAEAIHFNGDWRGTRLCRRGKCIRYEDVFTAERAIGPEER